MKIVYILLFLVPFLDAGEYYAKAQPVDTFYLKAAANGLIVDVKEELEGKISDGKVVIMIDDKIDQAELSASKEKLALLNESIKLTKQSVSNSYRVMKIEKDNYERVKDLSSYSKLQKDSKLLAALNANNAYIQSKTSLQTLKTQASDLKSRITTLKDRIQKKHISVKKGDYIYKLYPREGDVVAIGAPLLESADISKARLTIFVTKEDIVGIENKKIYIDGKVTDYKIDKLWKVADSKNISAYKTEIIIDKPALFSTLMKVEFK